MVPRVHRGAEERLEAKDRRGRVDHRGRPAPPGHKVPLVLLASLASLVRRVRSVHREAAAARARLVLPGCRVRRGP